MPRSLTLSLTLLAMIAFAGSSLLCRLALQQTAIDPASFTALRIVSGALTLGLIVRLRSNNHGAAGSWQSALALFTSAAILGGIALVIVDKQTAGAAPAR